MPVYYYISFVCNKNLFLFFSNKTVLSGFFCLHTHSLNMYITFFSLFSFFLLEPIFSSFLLSSFFIFVWLLEMERKLLLMLLLLLRLHIHTCTYKFNVSSLWDFFSFFLAFLLLLLYSNCKKNWYRKQKCIFSGIIIMSIDSSHITVNNALKILLHTTKFILLFCCF